MKNGWPCSFAIAHRGASQLAPENTIAALNAAKKSGAQWVECDIQLTKDHEPVIFHDTSLKRTTNGRGLLSALTFNQLSKLDAGSWFSPNFKNERVPTLQEWLQVASQLKLGLNLEIKSNTKKESMILAEKVIDHLQKYWPAHSTTLLISSSNYFALMQIAERAKSVPLGLICEKKLSEKEMAALASANIVSVHQPFKVFCLAYIEQLHQHDLQALAYTVNDPVLVTSLKAMGIDGIFTDNEEFY